MFGGFNFFSYICKKDKLNKNMITSRFDKPLDYKEVTETIVNVLSDYLVKSKIKAMIIGLSGGLDSSVSSALCRLVSDKTHIPLYGVSLPCSTNKADEVSGAELCGKEFCNVFVENGIQDMFTVIERGCDGISMLASTPISQGNIKARLRMIILYDMASKMNGIVIDNDMLTEHMLGFYTINGDQFDISPLASLWKTEVYELAKYLKDNLFKNSKALDAAIKIIPTDGNGVSSSDLEQIMPNHTYYDVDRILMRWVGLDDRIKKSYLEDDFENVKGTVFEPLISEYGKDNVKRVIMRNVNTEYKRYPHPIPIDIFSKCIIKKA